MNPIRRGVLAGFNKPLHELDDIRPLDFTEVSILPYGENVLLEIPIVLRCRTGSLVSPGMFGHVAVRQGLKVAS